MDSYQAFRRIFIALARNRYVRETVVQIARGAAAYGLRRIRRARNSGVTPDGR